MNNKCFDNINGIFGFGCMRLPLNEDKSVNLIEFQKMVDKFMASGLNYFDTAHVYLDGKSETAIRECLVKKYPRDSFVLTNKLSEIFEKEEDLWPMFKSQLEACGVNYFDFFLMHAQGARNYPKYRDNKCYEFAQEMKNKGYVKHVGISFHDTAYVLDLLLKEHPEIEVVQLQFNYLDFDSISVQSKACYDVCVKHNKPVIVMEPVRGGVLANVTDDVKELFASHSNNSPASYALRFAASFDNIFMVLSGMSNQEQMDDNLANMVHFKPFSNEEYELVKRAKELIMAKASISCTGCRYCVAGCPQHILIPDIFKLKNQKDVYNDWMAKGMYHGVYTVNGHSKASECIKCGECELSCPQHLKIRDLLEIVVKDFEQ